MEKVEDAVLAESDGVGRGVELAEKICLTRA